MSSINKSFQGLLNLDNSKSKENLKTLEELNQSSADFQLLNSTQIIEYFEDKEKA